MSRSSTDLEHCLEVVGEQAAGMGHDLNNLLTLISGYSELLEIRLRNDPQGVELLERVAAAVKRASDLSSRLLSLGQSHHLHPVAVAPSVTLRSVASVLGRILGHDVEVRWWLSAEPGRIRIDPVELEQMLLNLATNARDAMPDGGRVDITVTGVDVGSHQSRQLHITAGRYVRISVADNGIGMDGETAGRCFDPLFTTKGPHGGSGLGLSSVRAAAVAAGGLVQVRTALGQGSTFDVYLPALPEVTGAETTGAVGSARGGSGCPR